MAQFAVHNQESFSVGDTVRVHLRVDPSRTQVFEGMVIAIKGEAVNKTITLRRIGAGNIGIERIFPLFSPVLEKVEVVAKGKVSRGKLYFLRKKPVREMAEITKRYLKRKAAQAASKKKTAKTIKHSKPKAKKAVSSKKTKTPKSK